jgi:hypothetical protein
MQRRIRSSTALGFASAANAAVSMIYTIERDGKPIAITNERNAIHKFGNCTIRWSNESERATFRELETRHKQHHWFRDKIDDALSWIWRHSFPMYRNV